MLPECWLLWAVFNEVATKRMMGIKGKHGPMELLQTKEEPDWSNNVGGYSLKARGVHGHGIAAHLS